MEQSVPKHLETTWVMNPHGIKVALPRYLAEEFVATKIGYEFTEPDIVPKTKRYPSDYELTEVGEKRRAKLAKVGEKMAEAGEETEDVLRNKAKELGIKSWHLKGLDVLRQEVAERE